jgi:hypothetical protein
VDRTREHLGPADRAVIMARQILLSAVRTVQNGGDPPGVSDSYHCIRAIEQILPNEQSWREVLLANMYPTCERELIEAR